ncbi:MAG: ParB/RepB/Spo0J family partition protein [Clostridia bacterium]|nr:ParB/RepB/Spo0J family partition protein [Clostridia bacterium]
MAKKGLGKGLDALFGDGKAEDIISPVSTQKDGEYVENIKLVDIEPNKGQPRKDFDDESLEELAQSIKEHGVITPIIVKRADNGFYTIVAGERRWRASKKAGLKQIPAIVKDLSEIQTQEIALIENLQRQDLNPVEEALGYKKLMDDFSLTQEQIAQKMGKSRSSVANSLRILSLPDDVVKLLERGDITFGHAKVILSCDTAKRQSEIAMKIVSEDLSVRATEQLLKEKPRKVKKEKKIDLNLKLAFNEIEKSMSSSLGTNVKIADRGNRGTIQIEYYSAEELERIVNILNKA